MEAIEGACFLDGEWESLYKLFSNDNPDVHFSQFPAEDEGLMNLLVGDQFCSQEAILTENLNESTSDGSYVDTLNQLTQLLNHDDQISSPSDFLVDNDLFMDQGPNNDDGGSDAPLPKKRARLSKQGETKGRSRKKNKKEIESNASQEDAPKIETTINLNGKKRASRGAATDPQSLYARKRRERINERLRILQKLVPNGTKVDISTMLEEAVHYVKFLQLQIKLLSSDEMWMYAPLAYNGFDVGLYERFSSNY